MANNIHNHGDTFVIRKAEAEDSNQIYKCVEDFATFLKSKLDADRSPEAFRNEMFGEDSMCMCFVATPEADPSMVVGYCVFYRCYSTWTGPLLYLEDIYIKPDYRKMGIGKQLFLKITQVGLEMGCRGIRLTVADCNFKAQEFWKGIGYVQPTEDHKDILMFLDRPAMSRFVKTMF